MARKQEKVKAPGRLARNIEQAQANDFILFNNAIMVRGYALAPLIGGAINLTSALILALAGVLLLIPVRVLGDLLSGVVRRRMRIVIYVLLSSLIIIPEMVFLTRWFGAGAIVIGLYLPLQFIDGIITWRAQLPERQGFFRSLYRAVTVSIGYAFVICAVGAIREILGAGMILGHSLGIGAIWPAAITAPGGLLIAALFAALWNVLSRFVALMMFTGVQDG